MKTKLKIKSLLLALTCGALPVSALSVSAAYGQQFGFPHGGASGGGSSRFNSSRGGTVISSSSSSSSSSSGSSGGTSSGGSANGMPFQRAQSSSNSATSRSVSVEEDGRNITVAEDNSGITVTIAAIVDGVEKKRTVKAANPRQLERKDSEAARLYHKHLGANGPQASARASARATARAGVRAGNGAFGVPDQGLKAAGPDGAPLDAQNLLRQHLRKQIEENADNPPMQELLRRSLQSLDHR